MSAITRVGTFIALTVAACLAVGCCDKEKKQIAYLNEENINLGSQVKEFRGQLDIANNRETDLLSQLEAKDMQLATARTEAANLKAQLDSASAGTGTAAGTADAGTSEKPVYRVTVASDILFSSGKATLTSAGKKALDGICTQLSSRYPGMTVRVYGYTDSDPIQRTKRLWQDNLDLSANRAMAVTRYLATKGMKAENVVRPES